MAGKKQNLDPMWKVLNKEIDLGEPTSFLDHVYLGCTQRQCEISKDIVDNERTMFESRISAVGSEKLPFPQNLRISSWSYDMAGHAKKCVERYCELANKTTQQLYKVSTPCIDDHHFKKEEEMKSVGELSQVCSQIVLKCLYLARIGRPDILWSNLVHKFIPMPQAMKIPAAKAAVDKEWEKLKKISAWNLTKVKSKKQVIDEARTSGVTVHFASLMDICHLKMLNWRQNTRHTKVELFSAVIL